MKKPLFCAALLAALTLLPLAAQTGAGALTMLNTKEYSSLFISKNTGLLNLKYSRAISSNEDRERIASLNGESNLIDTPLEISLLSYAAGVIDVRPVEADAILPANNPRLSGLKLGSAVWKELTEIRFLDPSNTAAIGRYEGMIKFISDKNGVSRAEIESYYRQGIGAFIAAEVDAQFNRVSGFMLDRKYNVILIRNADNQYILSYERPSIENDDKELSAASLEALSSVMRNSGDFSATAFNEVRSQAALIPAVALGTRSMGDIKAILTNFYTSPNVEAYAAVRDVYALFFGKRGHQVLNNARLSYGTILSALNTALAEKVFTSIHNSMAVTVLTTAQQQRLTNNLE